MHSQNIVHPAGWTAGQAGEDVLKQSGFLNWITFPSFNSAHVTGDTAQLNSWVSSQVLNLWPLPTSGALSIAQLFSRLSASSLFSLQCIYQFYPSLKVALLKRLLSTCFQPVPIFPFSCAELVHHRRPEDIWYQIPVHTNASQKLSLMACRTDFAINTLQR